MSDDASVKGTGTLNIEEMAYERGWHGMKSCVLALFSEELLDRDPSLVKIKKAIEEMECP